MTREEAIQMLRLYEVNEFGEGELNTWYHGIDKDMREAIDMAIEALLADTVSREMYDDVVQTIIKREKQFTNMVSVVRCKDCRHRDLFSCPLADNDFQKNDDYCSWGERRKE